MPEIGVLEPGKYLEREVLLPFYDFFVLNRLTSLINFMFKKKKTTSPSEFCLLCVIIG